MFQISLMTIGALLTPTQTMIVALLIISSDRKVGVNMGFHKGSRKGNKIEWIVCHYPVAPGCSANWCFNYYQKTSKKKSAHYAVCNALTVEMVPCKYAAWHCSTDKKKTYCKANNLNSIGIDLMENKVCKETMSVNDNDWYIEEKTLHNAAVLIAALMKKYNIDIEHVVRHYDVTHKLCPRPLVGDDVNVFYGITGNERWKQFKQEIISIINKDDCDLNEREHKQ